MSYRTPWSAAERAALRDLYPALGAKETAKRLAAQFPDAPARSWRAVFQKAWELDIGAGSRKGRQPGRAA